MGDIVRTFTDMVGLTTPPAEVAANEASKSRDYQAQMWERQFGDVNDALKKEMMSVLGYTQQPTKVGASPGFGRVGTTTPGEWVKGATNPWVDKFKQTMRSETESGIRPGEEAARAALLDRVRANPRSMSSQSYAKGLGDIVREGSAARGTAFRSGATQAELTPYNMSLAFMGRQPFAPNVNPVYPPDYKIDTEGMKMLGGGLSDVIKSGSNMYQSLFGPRETGDSGFESSGVFPDATSSDLLEYGWD